ncbi:unnamed protein product [Parajaminaea phylloscopi]
MLPRVGTFPILPEGHLVYKASQAIKVPAKERRGCPLIGHIAPEIILKDQLGRDCSLHATIELGRPIVLFFFPLAGSPHCTIESCSFRDALGESAVFAELDAIVIGISQDAPETLKKFVDEHDLGYIILSDDKREAMQTFGVEKMWLGLLNNRCTFVLDHEGVVRGMCEGVFDGLGHKNFAERWLVRIEHELAGRTRDVSLGDASDSAFFKPMTSEALAGVRVKHGVENSAAGAGIDRAPRYGASAVTHKLDKSKKRSMRHFLTQLAASDGKVAPSAEAPKQVRGTGSDHCHDRRPSDGLVSGGSLRSDPSTTNLSVVNGHPGDKHGSLGRKSFLKVFGARRGSTPPVPPAYVNFDQDVRLYGERTGTAGGFTMTASNSTGSHREWEQTSARSSGSAGSLSHGHARDTSIGSSSKSLAGPRSSNGSHAAHTTVRSPSLGHTVPPTKGPELGLSPAELFAQRSNRPQVAEVGDLAQGANAKRSLDTSSARRTLHAPLVEDLPRRSRDVPDDVPLDADANAEDDTEEFVTQLANGAIDLNTWSRHDIGSPTGSSDHAASDTSARPRSRRSNEDGNGVTATSPGLSVPSPRVPPRPSSRRPPTSGSTTSSRPSSSRSGHTRPSADTVRPSTGNASQSPKSSQRRTVSHKMSLDSFGRTTPNGTGRSTPTALGPPPPRPSSKPSLRNVTPGPEDSQEGLQDAQIQSVKRLVIHQQPVSPRHLSRSASASRSHTPVQATGHPRAHESPVVPQPTRIRSSRSVQQIPAPPSSHTAPPPSAIPRPVQPKRASSDSMSSAPQGMAWSDGSNRSVSFGPSHSVGSNGSHAPSRSGSVSSLVGGSARRPSEASSIASIQSTGTFGPRRSSVEA